ncbi:MAG: selenium cofactor biosynthesis protein YqeC [Tissierellia bacterium]|nr:selenium cofactor biosynthesis protein YqeC [Tissierellia bacterium]
MDILLNIQTKDIISIVGSGGKTTLLFYLANQLAKRQTKKPILVTTTTKIYKPHTDLFEDEILLPPFDLTYLKSGKIYLAGNKIVDHKVEGLNFQQLDQLKPYFDNMLIEADGSKELPYKAWRESEPVIYPKTTKTVGVFPLKYMDFPVSNRIVFQKELFLKKFSKSGMIDIETILNIINDQEGLFKQAIGKKFVYFNQIEDLSWERINQWMNQLKDVKDIKILVGSTIKEEFYEINSNYYG